MTWNVENLFRAGQPGGPSTAAAYEAKLDGLAAMINGQAPDVVAVQEIGDPAALDDLTALLHGTWHAQVSTHPDDRGIRVAWLSTRPISDPVEITAFPPLLRPVQADDQGATLGHMGRGAVAISVTADTGVPVRLITTHLKSKLLTFPGGRFNPRDEDERARYAAYAITRRAAEAASLRVALTGALNGPGEHPVVLTGDLNDTPQAATTQLLLGPPGSEIGTRGFDQPDRGDQQRMWNLAPLMPPGQDYSRINSGRKELIDHILVSHAVVSPLTAVTAHAIIGTPLASIDPGDPAARHDAPASDHAPVLATFANL
ncbi:endonuclease/exonuclease/phosphatase family protein [Krasilnikovia sp. MM14-A1259]|uniref:endonuclease/exonuclease/phosphatase family protein n=1 Tax=Krasilnikovia sp. MM14-A1259 TaxID=3373539 RepID=UPI00399C664D